MKLKKYKNITKGHQGICFGSISFSAAPNEIIEIPENFKVNPKNFKLIEDKIEVKPEDKVEIPINTPTSRVGNSKKGNPKKK